MPKYVDCIATLLLVIGGLNWGLVGLFDLNLVSLIFGTSVVATTIYSLVGLSAIYKLFTCKWSCCK